MSKQILRLIPVMQGLTLAGENYKLLNKKKKTTKDMVGMGFKNIVGVEMMKETANIVEDF